MQEEEYSDGKVHQHPLGAHLLKVVPWQDRDRVVSSVLDLDSLEGCEDLLEEPNYSLGVPFGRQEEVGL